MRTAVEGGELARILMPLPGDAALAGGGQSAGSRAMRTAVEGGELA